MFSSPLHIVPQDLFEIYFITTGFDFIALTLQAEGEKGTPAVKFRTLKYRAEHSKQRPV